MYGIETVLIRDYAPIDKNDEQIKINSTGNWDFEH